MSFIWYCHKKNDFIIISSVCSCQTDVQLSFINYYNTTWNDEDKEKREERR